MSSAAAALAPVAARWRAVASDVASRLKAAIRAAVGSRPTQRNHLQVTFLSSASFPTLCGVDVSDESPLMQPSVLELCVCSLQSPFSPMPPLMPVFIPLLFGLPPLLLHCTKLHPCHHSFYDKGREYNYRMLATRHAYVLANTRKHPTENHDALFCSLTVFSYNVDFVSE